MLKLAIRQRRGGSVPQTSARDGRQRFGLCRMPPGTVAGIPRSTPSPDLRNDIHDQYTNKMIPCTFICHVRRWQLKMRKKIPSDVGSIYTYSTLVLHSNTNQFLFIFIILFYFLFIFIFQK